MKDDIHSLLGRYFNGQVTGEEAQEVKKWASENAENGAEFRLLEKLWMGTGEETEVKFDTERAWNKVVAQTLPQRGAKTLSLTFSRIITGIAALLLLVLGIWWIAGKEPRPESVVAATDVQVVKLEDGSVVYLRKGSTLDYPPSFAAGERRVSLKGEAFFEVSHNPKRPFIITASETEIKVLGTSFNVNTDHNRVDLVVKTGRVQFSNKTGDAVIVSAGEMASFDNKNFATGQNTDVNFNAWQTREMKFNRTPLEKVLATISDYYGVQISIREEDKAQISKDQINGIFKEEALSTVLEDLSLITTYSIHKLSDTKYEISIK